MARRHNAAVWLDPRRRGLGDVMQQRGPEQALLLGGGQCLPCGIGEQRFDHHSRVNVDIAFGMEGRVLQAPFQCAEPVEGFRDLRPVDSGAGLRH
jgi:hypothetical protein